MRKHNTSIILALALVIASPMLSYAQSAAGNATANMSQAQRNAYWRAQTATSASPYGGAPAADPSRVPAPAPAVASGAGTPVVAPHVDAGAAARATTGEGLQPAMLCFEPMDSGNATLAAALRRNGLLCATQTHAGAPVALSADSAGNLGATSGTPTAWHRTR